MKHTLKRSENRFALDRLGIKSDIREDGWRGDNLLPVRFVVGRAGSGKTVYCLDRIRRLLLDSSEMGVRDVMCAITAENATRAANAVYIVPEQFNLQAEKELIAHTRLEGVSRASVLSFKRLAHRVFEETGGKCRKYINSAGKKICLMSVIDELAGELEYFVNLKGSDGFVDNMATLITELKQYEITVEKIRKAIEKIGKATEKTGGWKLGRKLYEISLIFDRYCRKVDDGFLDSDDDLTKLSLKIRDSAYLAASEIFINGFSGFTAQELKVIGELAIYTREVTICLCCDSLPVSKKNLNELDVFYPVKRTYFEIIDMLKESNTDVSARNIVVLTAAKGAVATAPLPAPSQSQPLSHPSFTSLSPPASLLPSTAPSAPPQLPPQSPSQLYPSSTPPLPASPQLAPQSAAPSQSQSPSQPPPRLASQAPDLSYLEQNLFNYRAPNFKGLASGLTITVCRNYFEEVEYIASDIINARRERGYRLRDIAVICGDLEAYAALFRSVFSKYGIECFIDKKSDIINHPLVVLMLSALSILEDNFDYEAVFSYLKTGLTDVSRQNVDLIENYVLAYGIAGGMWTRDEPWHYLSRALHADNHGGADYLSRVNKIRNQVRIPLLRLREEFRKAENAGEYCRAFYNFLKYGGVVKTVSSKLSQYARRGDTVKESELKQVWAAIMDVLNQIYELSPGIDVSVTIFSKLLRCGLADHQIGQIPPSVDQVLVGSVSRTITHSVRRLYIAGAVDGVLPGREKDEGILTEAEKSELADLGLKLSTDSKKLAYDEQYNSYSITTIPSHELTISYPIADLSGKQSKPSMIIPRLRKLFPKHIEIDLFGMDGRERFLYETNDREMAFDSLVTQIRESCDDGRGIPKEWKAVYDYMSREGEYAPRLKNVLASLEYRQNHVNLSEETLSLLFGGDVEKRIKMSVSRLEQYAACPFSYFGKYIIGANDRKIYTLELPDIGSFVHKAIELVSRRFTERLTEDVNYRELAGAIGGASAGAPVEASAGGSIEGPIGASAGTPVGASAGASIEAPAEASLHASPWKDIGFDECLEESELVVNELLSDDDMSIFSSTERNKYLTSRLKDTVAWTIYGMAKHFESGEYIPWGFEADFHDDESTELVLDNDWRICLTGVIDRIDLAPEIKSGAAQGFVRVIDFKTGSRDLSLQDIYYGISFQLPVYLDRAIKMLSGGMAADHGKVDYLPGGMTSEHGKADYLPGGMFYFEVKRPMLDMKKKGRRTSGADVSGDYTADYVTSDSGDEADNNGIVRADGNDRNWFISDELLELMGMNGLFIGDEELFRTTVDRKADKTSGVVKGISFKAGGGFYSRVTAPTQEDFKLISERVNENIKRLCGKLTTGDFSITPYKNRGKKPCNWCPYSGACGVELIAPGAAFRHFLKLSDKEVITRLTEYGRALSTDTAKLS